MEFSNLWITKYIMDLNILIGKQESMDEVTYVKKKKKSNSNIQQQFLNSVCITKAINDNPLPSERNRTETSAHHVRHQVHTS